MIQNSTYTNVETGDKIHKFTCDNGLNIYICPVEGYEKKIGMIGTHYGSIDTTFRRIADQEIIKVQDGIAHFLEHKLFEQEDGNALDMFARMGVSSNAYTSYDHTVYFFETEKDYEKCIDTLFNFINSPFFTDDNVEKEKGIIAQELNMYEDDPNSVVYYSLLNAMYNKFPLNIDIGGTVESINKITKEQLYDSYYAFYNPKNMFVILIADISNVQKLFEYAKKTYKKYCKAEPVTPERFYEEEEIKVAKREVEKKLDIYMPQEYIGFKLKPRTGKDNIKMNVLTDIVSKMYFSNYSDIYEELYNSGLIKENISLFYESGKEFSHVILAFASKEIKECEKKILEYIENLKNLDVDYELFETAVKAYKGEMILSSEDPMGLHREIITSILEDTTPFFEVDIINNLTTNDVKQYISEVFDNDNYSISRVIEK